jgi:nucleoid DNA-binding protein
MSKALTKADLAAVLMEKLNFEKKEAMEFVKLFRTN